MTKFQRISIVFPDRKIDIDIDAFPAIDRYETRLSERLDWWIPIGVASSPDAALGYAAQMAVKIADQHPCEIRVDPAQEFVSTADTLSKLARYGVWAEVVREH